MSEQKRKHTYRKNQRKNVQDTKGDEPAETNPPTDKKVIDPNDAAQNSYRAIRDRMREAAKESLRELHERDLVKMQNKPNWALFKVTIVIAIIALIGNGITLYQSCSYW